MTSKPTTKRRRNVDNQDVGEKESSKTRKVRTNGTTTRSMSRDYNEAGGLPDEHDVKVGLYFTRINS